MHMYSFTIKYRLFYVQNGPCLLKAKKLKSASFLSEGLKLFKMLNVVIRNLYGF